MAPEATATRVLFVCLGNTCRSPTAHGVFAHKVAAQGLTQRIEVDSCGTGNWHVGRAPDSRASAEAAARGYDLSTLRARQLRAEDFDEFDYILAMDRQNLADLEAMRPGSYAGKLALFLDYAPGLETDVPDPYYGEDAGFAQVLTLVEAASEGLLREIESARAAH